MRWTIRLRRCGRHDRAPGDHHRCVARHSLDPGQALFEGGSRTYVYTPSGASFTPQDVKLVRRSESQVVVEGLREASGGAFEPRTDAAEKGGRNGFPVTEMRNPRAWR